MYHLKLYSFGQDKGDLYQVVSGHKGFNYARKQNFYIWAIKGEKHFFLSFQV